MNRYDGSRYQDQQLRYDHRSGLTALFGGATLTSLPFGACLSAQAALPWWLGPLLAVPAACLLAGFRVHYHGLPRWPRPRSIGRTEGEFLLMGAVVVAVTIACIWHRVGLCGQISAIGLALGCVFMGFRLHNTGLMIAAEARHSLLRLGARAPSWPPSHREMT